MIKHFEKIFFRLPKEDRHSLILLLIAFKDDNLGVIVNGKGFFGGIITKVETGIRASRVNGKPSVFTFDKRIIARAEIKTVV